MRKKGKTEEKGLTAGRLVVTALVCVASMLAVSPLKKKIFKEENSVIVCVVLHQEVHLCVCVCVCVLRVNTVCVCVERERERGICAQALMRELRVNSASSYT